MSDSGPSENDGRPEGRPDGRPRGPTPICAIGASAGGVQALQEFFRRAPTDLGLCYVVIVHLAPDHPSAMHEILGDVTAMPVRQVTDSPRLAPDCVFVIPPDRELVIQGDDVAARPFTEPRGRRAPIDMFFRSIAAARGDGIAIVLSGAGADGANGVGAVKEAGGVVLVQDPAEAEHPMMPRSAIATGAADFVGSTAALATRVAEVTRSKAAVRAIRMDEHDHDVRRIMGFVRAHTGHDFSSYKRATILRRIGRRMQVTRHDDLHAYARFLIGNPEEAQELFEDLLISVTSFFRDPAAYASLAEGAVGPMIEEADEVGVRAWVVGCATGEEAYSLAILLLEEAQRRRLSVPIQIFATDLDEGALATAREGRYLPTIEADVGEARLKRWFVREGQHYRIKKEVRDVVLFASHSVLKDPPFMRLDLVSCRNVLIYLERELQRQVCALFHYGLKPHGFLFLGSAETVEGAPDSFFPVDREARIYRARPTARRAPPIVTTVSAEEPVQASDPREARGRPDRRRLSEQDRGVAAAHAASRETVAPPSALVDHENGILHLSARAGRFLLAGEGMFTTDIVAQVRPELRLDLSGALRRALEQGETTLTLPVPVTFDGAARRVMLHVAPAPEEGGAPVRRAVVFFLDAGPIEDPGAHRTADGGAEEVRRLREELRLVEERLKLTRVEHEAAIQDLRIANEELQSVNEEYRSTGEELETSKEELQSMNEELQTVNLELKSKLESISTAHSDLRNLVTSTEIGTLFLDPELYIRMFTPAVTEFFSITEADVGRRISDFTHRLAHDGIEGAAARVLRTLAPYEEEVATRDGRWLIMRLRPYRTVDDRIDGLVVTFVDVSARLRAEQALDAELRAMDRLQKLATRVVEAEELEPPLRQVLEAAIDLVGAQGGSIQLVDARSGEARIAVHLGLPQAFVARLDAVAAEAGAEAEGPGTAQPGRVRDLEADPASAPLREAARTAGLHGQASMPLLTTSGRRVGALNANFRDPRALSEPQVRLLSICARQAADAIHAHQLQEKLRASEARLSKVLETEAVGVLFFDDAGVLLEANDAFLRMTGYDRDRIRERRLTWRSMTPPEYVALSERHLAELERADVLGPYEKELTCADGSRLWMLFAGRRIEPDLIAEYAIDISGRKRAETERELLSRELSHRVKNTLAVVQALVRQTRGDTVEAFREGLIGRLSALAKAHDVLLGADWRSADLATLVDEAMAPYGRSDGRVRLAGGPVALTARQALTLSLVLHELATNALKHGALSKDGGWVDLSWSRTPAGQGAEAQADGPGAGEVRLTWTERGGPPAAAPTRTGFGMTLIARALDYDLGGTARIDWSAEGLRVEIAFPQA